MSNLNTLFFFVAVATCIGSFAHADSVDSCREQAECLRFNMTLHSSSLCSGQCAFRVCATILNGPGCDLGRSDSINYICKKPSDKCLTSANTNVFQNSPTTAVSRENNQGNNTSQCQLVAGNTEASFLFQDGYQCTAGNIPPNALGATCSSRTTNSGITSCARSPFNGDACIWKIRTPACPPPTNMPSAKPSASPSSEPSAAPIAPSASPSSEPSAAPIAPSASPSSEPSAAPIVPSASPSSEPSAAPIAPSAFPSSEPSASPVVEPLEAPSSSPSKRPSSRPSALPSRAPGRSISTCNLQSKCIKFTSKLENDGKCNGKCRYKICAELKFDGDCKKPDDGNIFTCKKPSNSCATSTFPTSGRDSNAKDGDKQCQLIAGGATAQFLFRDGLGCAYTRTYWGYSNKLVTNCAARPTSVASCQARSPDCLWTVTAPKCP